MMPILDILLLAVIAAALGTALLLRGKTPCGELAASYDLALLRCCTLCPASSQKFLKDIT
jgi:hypothetical protein